MWKNNLKQRFGLVLVAVMLICFAPGSGGAVFAVTSDDLVWVVEPTLDYEGIVYCGQCGFFTMSDDGWYDIQLDPKTGKKIGDEHLGHGGGYGRWIYDPVRDLMGLVHSIEGDAGVRIYPINEFATHFPDAVNQVNLVYNVDSSLREKHDYDEDHYAEWLLDEAYSGKCAVAVGSRFVTEFTYDFVGEMWGTGYGWWTPDSVTVRLGDKYSIIGRDGIPMIPFVVDNIVRIDEGTAFAALGGRYGILDIDKTRENMDKTTEDDTELPEQPGEASDWARIADDQDNADLADDGLGIVAIGDELESGGIPLPVVLGILALLIAGGVAAVVLKKRKKQVPGPTGPKGLRGTYKKQ